MGNTTLLSLRWRDSVFLGGYHPTLKLSELNYDLNLETAEFLELGLCDFGETMFSARHSLRSCPLPIIPLCLSREEGMIHFFVGSHVKMPESGLFSD